MQLSKSHEVENAVEAALRRGYRHIDAAACYLNETEVGAGWKKSGVPREQIFVSPYILRSSSQPGLLTIADNQQTVEHP